MQSETAKSARTSYARRWDGSPECLRNPIPVSVQRENDFNEITTRLDTSNRQAVVQLFVLLDRIQVEYAPG